jgi:hypothetical protein
MANVIFRGPVSREPETINLPVAGAYLPGTFVTSDGEELTQATVGSGRLLLLGNRRFYDQGPLGAYEAEETAVAYRLEPEHEYQAAMAAGTYAFGAPLTVGAAGRLTAATAETVVVAYFDQAGGTLTAGALADVVIARGHTVPAE